MRRYALFLFLIPMALLFSSCGLTKKTPAARYEEAQALISEGRYREAVKILEEISGYDDASRLCTYARALEMADDGDYEAAVQSFQSLGSFRDSGLQAVYYTARRLEKAGKTEEALEAFRSIASFRDSRRRAEALAGSTVEIPEETAGYWPSDVTEQQIVSEEWRLDFDDISAPDASGLTTLSVSPSGQYIAAADRIQLNMSQRNAAGVANPFGRLPDAIYLFARKGDHYKLQKTIPVDIEAQLELSSILGGGSAFAWNEDETRVIVTGDWGAGSELNAYIANYHTNLYLVDLMDGSTKRLTDNSEAGEHSVLVKWCGSDTIRYLRSTCKGVWSNSICEMDLTKGAEKKLADLFDAGGAVCPIYAWEIAGKNIYYTAGALSELNGFYVSPLNGKARSARCLISTVKDLVETKAHPYCANGVLGMEISSDGRWACLTLNDRRIVNRDIPLSDDARHPQTDPANAVSVITGTPWVPCHDVLLYDLESEQLVDPFTDEALAPAPAFAVGACFAPDSQSLLCAVFGDGGSWTMDDFFRTTFYQISLTDGAFTAVRVFKTELQTGNWFPRGFRWLKGNVLCIPTGSPPAMPVLMIKPAAFGEYPDD